MQTYHVGSKSGRCHSGKVRCASVVLATANDCYSAELTWFVVSNVSSIVRHCNGFNNSLPLWNFSSMGGTILYTLPKSSLRVKLEAMFVDVLGICRYIVNYGVSIGKSNCKLVQRRDGECFCCRRLRACVAMTLAGMLFGRLDRLIDDVMLFIAGPSDSSTYRLLIRDM
jgi:hypothetical protein